MAAVWNFGRIWTKILSFSALAHGLPDTLPASFRQGHGLGPLREGSHDIYGSNVHAFYDGRAACLETRRVTTYHTFL